MRGRAGGQGCGRFISRLVAARPAADVAESDLDRVDRGNVEQPLDHLGFLRPGYRMRALDNETRHAIDSEPMGSQIVGVNGFGLLFEARKRRTWIGCIPNVPAMPASTS